MICKLVYIASIKRVLPSRLGTYARKDAWAVVTGCTDGIGREFALQLAKKGFNVLLLSRSREKLDAVAQEITQASRVKTRQLAVDFERPDSQALSEIINSLPGPITVLVNNVGVSLDWPERFLDIPAQRLDALLALNIAALQLMCRLVMPNMLENKCGLVLNIGSGSAVVPSPMLAPYAASKKYVSVLSRALQVEYSGKGLHVEVLSPLYVVSKLSKMRRSFTTPTASYYVRSALSQCGRSSEHAGFWIHDCILCAFYLLGFSRPNHF